MTMLILSQTLTLATDPRPVNDTQVVTEIRLRADPGLPFTNTAASDPSLTTLALTSAPLAIWLSHYES